MCGDFILPRMAVAWVVGEEEDLQGTWPHGRGFGRLGRITSPSSFLGQTGWAILAWVGSELELFSAAPQGAPKGRKDVDEVMHHL